MGLRITRALHIDKNVLAGGPTSVDSGIQTAGASKNLLFAEKCRLTYSATDDMSYRVEDGKIYIHDLHATMLHLLDIDHLKLTWRHLGRDYRLTDVYGEAVKEIIA